MKKFRKVWMYLIFAFCVSITLIILSFTNQLDLPKIVQDINAGVISAILTSLITMTYLSIEAESEEDKTKKTVIYEEKLKVFNQFLAAFADAMADGILDTKDIRTIVIQHAAVRMHLDIKRRAAFDRILLNIDHDLFFVNENQTPNFIKYSFITNSLCEIFRFELYEKKEKDIASSDKFNLIADELPKFNNFQKLSASPKTIPLPISSIAEAYSYLLEEPYLISTGEKISSKFKCHLVLANNFKNTHEVFSKAIEKNNFEGIEIIFNLNKVILDETYLKCPSVHIKHNNNLIFKIYISNRARVVVEFHIKDAKQQKQIEKEDGSELSPAEILDLIGHNLIEQTYRKVSSLTQAI